MKTIFITSFHPFISRNFFSTNAFKILLNSNLRIVIFVLSYKVDYFKNKFSHPNVIIEGINFPSPSSKKISLFIKRLTKFGINSNSVRIERLIKWKKEGNFFYFIMLSISGFFIARVLFLRKIVRFMDYKLSVNDRYRLYFKKYKPDLVFITDVQNERDVELMHNARKFGVVLLSMVRTWDNLTLHGMMRVIPDKLLVPGEKIKEIAIRYHDLKPGDVEIVGQAHYDNYFKGPRVSKEEFCKSINFNPAKKIIFHAVVGDKYISNNDTDPYILNIFSKLDYQIFVRFSPTIPVKSLDGFVPYDNMFFDKPGVNFKENIISDQEIGEKDDINLMNAIYWSDIVTCGPSTIAIDAAYFNKPVILIGFYPRERDYFDGLHRYDYDHMRSAIDMGACRLAKSREEFLGHINAYMNNPKLDSENRARLRSIYSGLKDGGAGERIANVILKYIDN